MFYIRYNEKKFIMDHVDPHRYGYLELISNRYGYVLIDIPANESYMFVVRFRIPLTNQHLELKIDNDILEKFKMYRGRVGIYLDVVDVQMVIALVEGKPLK